jgi:hypothetical protein
MLGQEWTRRAGGLLVAVVTGLWLGAGTPSGADPAPRQGGKKLEDAIRIQFPPKGYEFTTAEAAKGIKIGYHLVVSEDVPKLTPLPHGPSHATPPGPSGLYPLERIAGNGQVYCLQDFGLGAPPKGVARTVKRGKYLHAFTWDGRNWLGPSDTGQAKGKPFPPGTYTLTVTLHGFHETAAGKKAYTISGSTKLVLK